MLDAALGWIGDIVKWLLSLLPHIGICRAGHEGVKFVRGKNVHRIKPGMFFWWPLTTLVERIPVTRQTLNLPPQRLVTKDGVTVMINLVVIYHVEDVVKALVDTYNWDDTATDAASEASTNIVMATDYEALQAGLTTRIRAKITSKCRTFLRDFGLYVETCRISDFCKVRVLSIDWNPSAHGSSYETSKE